MKTAVSANNLTVLDNDQPFTGPESSLESARDWAALQAVTLLALDLASELMSDVIGRFVLAGQTVVEGFKPAPAQGFLNPGSGPSLQQQLFECFAVKEVFGLQFSDGESLAVAHLETCPALRLSHRTRAGGPPRSKQALL
jgi:hypothetical protein